MSVVTAHDGNLFPAQAPNPVAPRNHLEANNHPFPIALRIQERNLGLQSDVVFLSPGGSPMDVVCPAVSSEGCQVPS